MRPLAWTLVAAAVAWHLAVVLYPAWKSLGTEVPGRDFATYYYAAKVAESGGDPWAKTELGEASRADETRKGVHPFLYPPPFLLVVAWAPAFELHQAFEGWFWLDELFAIAAFLALWRAWRPLGPAVGTVLATLMAAVTALPNNHAMGQANLLPLALVAAGWWAEDRGRRGLAGALVGAACVLKMSPALFVILWIAQRQWRPVAASLATALALSAAALPLAGPWTQLRFYTDVLPTFSSGGYNGLSVSIQLFGNHSIPNLVDQVFPGTPHGLSTPGHAVSVGIALALVGGLCWSFRRPTDDPLARAARVSAIGVASLLIPVYTYEHHLVWAIPAAVVLPMALARGRLGLAWAVPVGLAVSVWAFDLDVIRDIREANRGFPLAATLQEFKSVALFGLLAATVRAGRAPA